MNIAHMMQRPARLAAMPVTLCSEAAAVTKDAFVAAGGVWTLLTRVVWASGVWSGPRVWGIPGIVDMAGGAHRSWVDPIERAYAAASTDYVKDARRVIDAFRSAADDESDRFGDPLASGWDDVVRRPSLLTPDISAGTRSAVPSDAYLAQQASPA